MTLADISDAHNAARLVEDVIGAGRWSWNLSTGLMYWSQGFGKLLGLGPTTAEQNFASLELAIYPSDRRYLVEIKDKLSLGLAAEHDLRILRPDGRLRWVSTRAEPIFNRAGQVEYVVGVTWDITKHHERLLPTKMFAARYHALVEATEGLVQTANGSGVVTCWSPPLGGLAHERDFLDPSSLDEKIITEQCARAVNTKAAQRCEYKILDRDGRESWVKTTAVPVIDDTGDTLEFIRVTTNVDSTARGSLPADTDFLTGAQIRAARGILGWSVKDLAEIADVSHNVIRRYEESDFAPAENEASLQQIREACEKQRVEFVFSKNGKPGVRPR